MKHKEDQSSTLTSPTVSNHTQGKIQTRSHGHKMWLPPTTDVTSYHSTPLPYNYRPAQGQPAWLPPALLPPKLSLHQRPFFLPQHSSPDPFTPFRSLHKISASFTHSSLLRREKKTLSKTAPQPIFVFFPIALITT